MKVFYNENVKWNQTMEIKKLYKVWKYTEKALDAVIILK